MLLSICVPAFNQANQLRGTLAILEAPEVRSFILAGELEIIVSNNASEDDSSDIEFSTSADLCSWFNQTTNIGFTSNLKFLASKSRGKFIWFLGCGEQISPTSLGILLQTLRTVAMNATNLVLGASAFNEATQSKEPFVEINQGRLQESSPGGLLPIYSESISQNVYSRSLFLKLFANVQFTGDIWPHVEFALELAKNGQIYSYYLDKEFVTLFREEHGWWTATNSHRILLAYACLLARYPTVRKNFPSVARTYKSLVGTGIASWILMLKSSGGGLNPFQPVNLIANSRGLPIKTRLLVWVSATIPSNVVSTVAYKFKALRSAKKRNK